MNRPAEDLQQFLTSRRERIDAALEHFLPKPPACPARLSEAMRYSVFAGGKRFRPILTLAAAEAIADIEPRPPETLAAALPAACAIELIHTYSLIHDDLPAMDDDTLRRGRPTAHIVYGEGIAILSGDALLTEAFNLVVREPFSSDDDLHRRKLLAIATIAKAAGARGMVGGQTIDLQVSNRVRDPQAAAGQVTDRTGVNRDSSPRAAFLDLDGLRDMHARKTGALIRAAAAVGAIMAGGSDSLIRAIEAYAEHLGLAFQIIDDILDVEGAPGELGKTAGKDAAAGKPTYPAVYGLEESRRLAAASIARAHDVLQAAGLRGWLGPIANWVIARTH